MNYNKEKILTIFSRGIAIVFKPLLLIVLTSINYENSARQISVIYLALTYGMMFSSFDAHKSYYYSFFNTKENTAKNFINYLLIFFYSAVFGGFFVLIISYFEFNLDITIFYIFLYFFSEKFIDEVLRFKLFNKQFYSWSKLVLLRFFLVVAIFFGLIFYELSDSDFIKIFTLNFTLINFLTVIFFFDFIKIFRLFSSLVIDFKTTLSVLKSKISESLYLYFSNIFSIAYSSYDRLIVFIIDREFLPIITVIIMIFSVIPVSFETIYFSFRRSEILNQKERFYENLFSKKTITLILLVLMVTYSGFLIYNYLQNNIISTNLILIGMFIMINQLLLALTLIPKDMYYWKQPIKLLLFIEIRFSIILLVLFGAILIFISKSYIVLASLILIGIILFFRFRKYLLLTRN